MLSLKSLSTRLKLLTILWLTMAILSISLTLLFLWRLEGSAAAINDTGSLRKQTYHLALLITQKADEKVVTQKSQEFEKTLQTLEQGDPKRPLFLPDNTQVHQLMVDLQQTWFKQMKPHFQAAYQMMQSPNTEEITSFINKIDALNYRIEQINARYIQWLHLFQLGLMILVLMSSFVMINLLYLWVINPLRELQNAMRRVHQGQLGVHVKINSLSEFADLDHGFNQMSSHLQQLYSNLEQQVKDKTIDLEQKTYTLQTLYFFAHFLNLAQTSSEASQVFLEKIMKLVPAQAGSIRLIDLQRQQLDLIAHKGLPENLQTAESCQKMNQCFCGQAVQKNDWQPIDFIDQDDSMGVYEATCQHLGFHYLHVFKIQYKNIDLGIMTLYFNDKYDFSVSADLFNSLCYQLGSAISNIRLAEESRQLAVMQERNLMAQGLHDSIAQTLTFLNLQVQMLESAFYANKREHVAENLQFIKDGVKECYEDIRELLLNFRTKITRKEFVEAVETLVKRFEQQTQVKTEISWNGTGTPLSSEQQLQFIFILQESLSNIRKHAKAQKVSIQFDNYDNYSMIIKDDGNGFDTNKIENISAHHVGLNIMRERALRIHAYFEIQSCPQHYTIITLTLPKSERILE